MELSGCTVVVGGTSRVGLEVARWFLGQGSAVVVTGRDAGRAETTAKALGGDTRGIAFDLAEPEQIQAPLVDVGPVANLVLAARTPTGRQATTADIVDAVDFLIRNQSVNGIDLYVDGGTMLV